MGKKLIIALVLGVAITCAARADSTQTSSISFEQCVATIQATATKLGTVPVNIVETSILRIVRFSAADGSMLITCSKPDRKMIVQLSANRCGVDVEC